MFKSAIWHKDSDFFDMSGRGDGEFVPLFRKLDFLLSFSMFFLRLRFVFLETKEGRAGDEGGTKEGRRRKTDLIVQACYLAFLHL